MNIRFMGTIATWGLIEISNSWNGFIPAKEVICLDGVVTL